MAALPLTSLSPPKNLAGALFGAMPAGLTGINPGGGTKPPGLSLQAAATSWPAGGALRPKCVTGLRPQARSAVRDRRQACRTDSAVSALCPRRLDTVAALLPIHRRKRALLPGWMDRGGVAVSPNGSRSCASRHGRALSRCPWPLSIGPGKLRCELGNNQGQSGDSFLGWLRPAPWRRSLARGGCARSPPPPASIDLSNTSRAAREV